MSPGLSFKRKRERVDDLIADYLLDIRFDFIESKFPGEGKEFDLFFKLKVDVAFF
jgi:hypothetical protein